MPRSASSCLLALLMVGCPEESGSYANPLPQPGGEGSAPGGSNPASAAPQPGADGSLTLDLSSMQPVKTQDEMKAGAHVLFSGVVTGECGGTISLHAVGVSTGPANGPLTVLDLDAVGPFTMALPKSTAARIIPHCDANKDGIITVGKDGDNIAASVDLAAAEADVSGLAIDLAAPAALPRPGGPGGSTLGGEASPADGSAPPPADGSAPPADGAAAPSPG
ncbi:MAG: hypothetical protein FJ090_13510 [Deltaproteobacteria bacterium]|nr:hypothetical protein [Deltaproteobacteria bacterium]